MPQAQSTNFVINKIAVLGTSFIGAQIAALFAENCVPTLLFDSLIDEKNPNLLAQESINSLLNFKTDVLLSPEKASYIEPCNYTYELFKLESCDLIVEAISDNYEWKQDLYAKIALHIASQAILVTTSIGISVQSLSKQLPDLLASNFVGLRFFSPLKHMRLIEITPSSTFKEEKFNCLVNYMETNFNKILIKTKDTPNFIAHRIGIFNILSAIYHANILSLPPDVVDSLTGSILQRSNTAVYKTIDLLGIDNFIKLVENMQLSLKDDPWQKMFKVPNWIMDLAYKGRFGIKSKKGIYDYSQKKLLVYDSALQDYRLCSNKVSGQLRKTLEIAEVSNRYKFLKDVSHPEYQLIWRNTLDLLQYCDYHKNKISFNTADIDIALKWGYGWLKGPFELWDDIGLDLIHTWFAESHNFSNNLENKLMQIEES